MKTKDPTRPAHARTTPADRGAGLVTVVRNINEATARELLLRRA